MPVNMMLTLLKIPLILSDIICMRITAMPPNPPLAPGQHTVFIPDWRERFLRRLAWPCVFLRAVSHTLNGLQIYLIIASHSPTGAISKYTILHASPASAPACSTRLAITPAFALGTWITLVGAILRVQCYRTLGRHFTFELSLQKDHKLVTRGPYAVVRHPSYTAMMLTVVGGWMTLALRGSYVWECGVWESAVGRAIMGLWVGVAVAVVTSLVLRVSREDEMLRRRFGLEWEEWRGAVPWKFVPCLF
ncbi:hypothetical protein B0H10DRAFT_1974 [Mycena sp. CBHHK59/15]|nr:hypothetical protein B0H10DRAFT_1974 [Mycena sp. CBHHK59/15]